MRWVHGGKGQVAQQDRVKTTMTSKDSKAFTANNVPRKGGYHPTTLWNTFIAFL